MKIASHSTKSSSATPLKAMPLAIAAFAVALLGGCASNGGAGGSLMSGNVDGLLQAGKSAYQAATLSDAEVMQLSDRACKETDAQSKIAAPKSKNAQRLAKIIKNMPKTVGSVTLNYKVYEVKEVNAWAMGNGCVRVYSALMDMMNDDEVRAVLGHEIGHVSLGHSKAAMQVAYAAGAARQAAAASGNATAAALSASEMGALTEKLLNAQFSQAQESKADDYAFDLLTAAKLKRDGLVSAFEKLAKLGDTRSLLSSHPSSSDRAQHMRDRIAGKN